MKRFAKKSGRSHVLALLLQLPNGALLEIQWSLFIILECFLNLTILILLVYDAKFVCGLSDEYFAANVFLADVLPVKSFSQIC